MKSIFIASSIATILAISFIIFLVHRMHKEWLWKLWPFFLLALPCSYLAYTYVRLPLDGIIRTALHVNLYSLPIPLPYILLTGLYAPLTEELIKLFPLVIPSLNRMVDRTTCAAVAMIILWRAMYGRAGASSPILPTQMFANGGAAYLMDW